MKRIILTALLALLVASAAFSLERPWSSFEELGPGTSYEQVKEKLPNLSPLQGGRAFVVDSFPFAHNGPLFAPNLMAFFQDNSLVGTYCFLQLEESVDEAPASVEYTGFVKWANANLTPVGKDQWRDGEWYVGLEVDQLSGITTLGFWWGAKPQEEVLK